MDCIYRGEYLDSNTAKYYIVYPSGWDAEFEGGWCADKQKMIVNAPLRTDYYCVKQ